MTQSAPREDQKLQITLLQERSAGTFARVYLAEARGAGGLSRVVAVKLIKEQWSDSHEILTRTRDEARLLARLQHKNILRAEALAEVDGQPAIVMEFVDGIDLQQLIERLGAASRRIPRRALFTIMADASSAVAAAWEQVPLNGSGPLRVVHRDLKPSNVMVSKQGEVKVLDFGTARFDFTERQARTGALRFGSLKYMSPERRRGERGDHPSDVYALGLLCIEMLQGQFLPLLPLDTAEHDRQLASSIAHLSDLGLPDSRWDDAARQTLSRMIASDPNQRLLASQIIPLFRAFSDSATGESLDAFSADTVAALTRDVYGSQTRPDLSGSRIFVAMTTSSELPVPEASPNVLAPSAAPATQAPGPLPVTVAPAPAPAPEAMEQHPPENSAPTAAIAVEVGPGTLTQPQTGSTGRSNLLVGIVAGLVVFAGGGLLLLLAGAGLGAWYYFSPADLQNKPAAISRIGPTADHDSTEDADRAALAEAAGDVAAAPQAGQGADPSPLGPFSIQIEAKDEMVQWIAIEDDAGDRRFKGKPGGNVNLPSGRYTLMAKVRARSTARGTLDVEGPLILSCETAEKGQVRCLPSQGDALVLSP